MKNLNVLLEIKMLQDSPDLYKNPLNGGLADSKQPKDFDLLKLYEGTLVEFEHTDDTVIAVKIAMDHLTEDLEYYSKLKTIEKH